MLLVSIGSGGPQGGSATQYFIGDFDGERFIPQDTTIRWIDHGADNYAGVTWSDIPDSDGRRLFIGWMSNWQYAQVVPTNSWRSAMTLPREISLLKKNNVYELQSYPVDELNSLITESEEFIGQAQMDLNEGSKISIQDSIINHLHLTFSNDLGDSVIVSIEKNNLTFDRSHSGIVNFHEAFSNLHAVGLTTSSIHSIDIWIDASSFEIFINKGEIVLTELVFPQQPYNQIKLKKSNPVFTVSRVTSALN